MSFFEKSITVDVNVSEILDDLTTDELLEYIHERDEGQKEMLEFVCEATSTEDLLNELVKGGKDCQSKILGLVIANNSVEEIANEIKFQFGGVPSHILGALWNDANFRVDMILQVCNNLPVVNLMNIIKDSMGKEPPYKSEDNKAEEVINAMWGDENFRLAMTRCVGNSVPVDEIMEYIKDFPTTDITTMLKTIPTSELVKMLKDSGRLNDLVLEMTKKIIESITTMGD